MGTKYAKLLVFGAGGAVLPFLVVAFYTWAMSGRPAGVVAMLGHGDLYPATALLAAQSLINSYAVPPTYRSGSWLWSVGGCWLLFAFACAGYTLPYAGHDGYQGRVAWSSLMMFLFSIILSVVSLRMEELGSRNRD